MGQISVTILGVAGSVLSDNQHFGARTVMVEMDDLYFVADDPETEVIDDTTLLLAMTQDELDALPEWDDATLRDGFAMQSGAGTAQPEAAPEPMDTTTDTAAAEPGEVIDDAFNVLDGAERTADLLIGADAFDISGDRVGTVEDVVVEVDNSISGLVIEVGGILGLGAHSVHVPLDDTEVGWRPSEEDVEVRVQVPMTVEELQALPEHPG